MLNKNYIEVLYNIKEEYVENGYFNEATQTYTFVLKLPVTPHTCPRCGTTTQYIKDYRVKTINFGKAHEVTTIGKYRQRRYFCKNCHTSFSESNRFVGKYMRTSKSTLTSIFNAVQHTQTYSLIAKQHNLSVTSVIRYFSQVKIAKPTALPSVLGIPCMSLSGLGIGKRAKT